jgi:hypothetical protein
MDLQISVDFEKLKNRNSVSMKLIYYKRYTCRNHAFYDSDNSNFSNYYLYITLELQK